MFNSSDVHAGEGEGVGGAGVGGVGGVGAELQKLGFGSEWSPQILLLIQDH